MKGSPCKEILSPSSLRHPQSLQTYLRLLLLLWRILNGRGLPNCMTELPSLKCLSSSLHSRDSHPFANVLRPSPSGSPSASPTLTLPSKNSFSNVLCCLMWPKYDSFCFLIRFKSCGAFTPSCSRTLAFTYRLLNSIKGAENCGRGG